MSNQSSGNRIFKALKTIGLLDKPFYAKEVMEPWSSVRSLTVEANKNLTKEILAQYISEMTTRHYNHLFVAESGKLVGYLLLENLMRNFLQQGAFDLTASSIKRMPYVRPQDSLYDVLGKMNETQSDAVAVIDDKGEPLGIITESDIQTKV